MPKRKKHSRSAQLSARPKRTGKKTKHRAASRSIAHKLPKDAVTLLVTLRAREGQETLLEAELRALVGPSRKESGCLVYDVHRGIETPGAFVFHEVWVDREALTAHTKTPHFLRWHARKDPLLASQESTFWKKVL
ncbi:MAG: hypothetical protein NVS9B4_06650 [Candidatus Acidiferrum sp.]